jgi:hypothetical protein
MTKSRTLDLGNGPCWLRGAWLRRISAGQEGKRGASRRLRPSKRKTRRFLESRAWAMLQVLIRVGPPQAVSCLDVYGPRPIATSLANAGGHNC